MHKLLDRFRQESGIYSIGFNPASVAGQLFPFLFVLIVGGALSAWIIMR
ncbi:MAG TPA: hypothetical protein VNP95_12775 [Thermomicrobiales bacterium]|nr:hypothetical protein [Thermomicrobiales bacterium]